MGNAFVGLNPVSGEGSGFIYRDSSSSSMIADNFGNQPDSGAGRNNLCTCECKPSASGVGCAGHAGINLQYGSLLWTDPLTGAWTGRMQGLQIVGGPTELNFIGTDTRTSPGGAAVYQLTCTQQECGGLFAGNFRQLNGAVSCAAGLAEDPTDMTTCAYRCGDQGVYQDWLAYCAGSSDTSDETGFTGYGQ